MMEKKIIKTFKELEDTLKKLKNVFAFDTETTSLRYDRLEITGISFSDGNIAFYYPITNSNRIESMEIIKEFFKHSTIIIAHNILFDSKVLWKYGIDITSFEWFDTMIASHLIDEERKYGLKFLSKEILDREVVEFKEVSNNYYTKKFYEYGLSDAINTYDLAMVFKKQLKKNKLKKLFKKIEMPFQKVLLEMLINGVLVNKEQLIKDKNILKTHIFNLKGNLYEAINEKYTLQTSLTDNSLVLKGNRNFNSSKQLSDILFNKLKLKIIEETPTGLAKTGRITIDHYREKIPFVNILYKYKIASKLYSGFIKPLFSFIEDDGVVRPSFNAAGTKTGRLSSSNPNLQQLPSLKSDYNPVNVRKLFVAPKGYKMFSVDYSGQEVAVAAQYSKDPTLVKALNKGYDMHLAIANKFYELGIPESKLSKTHPDYLKVKERYKKARTRSKRITFGLLYGKEAYGFSKDFNITEDEAMKIVDDYFKGMPKLKEKIDETHKKLRKDGYIRNLAGRLRHFRKNEMGYYPKRAFRQSFNFLIQSFSADMIRVAGINSYKLSKRNPQWDLKPIMTVHDEFVFLVKDEYVDIATREVKNAFERTVKNFIVPVKADIEIGTNYGNAK